MGKNKFDLAVIKNSMKSEAKGFLDGLQKELVEEEHNALKDFVKGAYRFSLEKQREIERLQEEVSELQVAIEDASNGKWDKLSNIKIPARFFEESTLRKHGKSLISGSSEIRFVDLYVPEKDED